MPTRKNFRYFILRYLPIARIAGNTKLENSNPPAKNPMVATREPKLSNESPIIACPEVHPFPYLVPKPTRNPPPTRRIRFSTETKDDSAKI